MIEKVFFSILVGLAVQVSYSLIAFLNKFIFRIFFEKGSDVKRNNTKRVPVKILYIKFWTKTVRALFSGPFSLYTKFSGIRLHKLGIAKRQLMTEHCATFSFYSEIV